MRLELSQGKLYLRDCDDDSIAAFAHIFGGARERGTRNYLLPLTLDAIQYFQKDVPSCDIAPEIPQFLERLDQVLKKARTFGELDYKFKEGVPPPFDHQKESMWFASVLDQAMGLLDTGCGKTRLAVDAMCYRHLKSAVDRVLVVAPNSIHKQWVNEIERFATVPNLDIRVIRGTKPQRLRILNQPMEPGRLTIVLVHYEALRVLRQELKALDCQMTICDETTVFKNHKSKIAKSLKKITEDCTFKLGLTGTPIWNRPRDIYSQYQWIDPFWFGVSFVIFKNSFLVYDDEAIGAGANKMTAYKNLEEMSRRLYSIGIRYKKEECIKGLPPQVFETRRVEMTPEQKKLYAQAKEEFIIFIEQAEQQGLPRAVVIQNALVRMLRLQQICCGHTTDENGDTIYIPTNKPKEVEFVLDEMMGEPDRKVVIWCRFIPDLLLLYKTLSPLYRCAKFYGGMKPEAKDAVLTEFCGKRRPDDSWELGPTQVLIAQTRTGGVGLDLWQASVNLFYSSEWSWGLRKQDQDRTFRNGSQIHKSITYFDIIGADSIEERILDVLRSKKELSDVIMEVKDLKTLLGRSMLGEVA